MSACCISLENLILIPGLRWENIFELQHAWSSLAIMREWKSMLRGALLGSSLGELVAAQWDQPVDRIDLPCCQH